MEDLMEDERFELFSDTVYTLIPLLKKHFLPVHEAGETGSITPSHFPLLFTLHFCGTLTMTEAAKKVGFSKPHMTLQVDKLVEEGLVERSTAHGDRRIIAIRLTDKGNNFAAHHKGLMKDKAWKTFSSLSDETLDRTLNALVTLKEVLTKAGTDGEERRRKGPVPGKRVRKG
jgi:DNA-binding MarR family transcriptional regulator